MDRLEITLQTRSARREAGRNLRRAVPRSAHAHWAPCADRRDPVEILIETGRGRIPELLPVRYQRMRASPFTFLRGAAAVMAADLATTPASLLLAQSCGDCHLNNFGTYLSPEDQPVFDINDFDETLPAPFEWDIKRLATSLVLAGQAEDMPDRACRALALAAVAAYRRHMAELAALPPLAAWRTTVDIQAALAGIDNVRLRSRIEHRLQRAWRAARRGYDLVAQDPAGLKIADKPPKVFHIGARQLAAHAAFARYAATLQEDRRALLSRYRLADLAFKVVGVGSVGTFCAIGLFADADGDTLLLQIKQAQASVLEPFAGASIYSNHGERVVTGQRIMQAATDLFLGWTHDPATGRDFYVRRLKDSRVADIAVQIEAQALPFTAGLCGQTLARAHARSADAAAITGYLGRGEAFDEAIAEFAMAYAAQTARDHEAFLAAIASGRIAAHEP